MASVARVVAFASGKGGVGKSVCAAVAALLLARGGRRVGLLDLDLQGASTHLFLGVPARLPAEERALLPHQVAPGLRHMSIVHFTGEAGIPLRGAAVSDAITELLAVTEWDDLDLLLVDLPPGIGDEVLDTVRLLPRVEALVVSMPRPLVRQVVRRLVTVLDAARVRIVGVVENMVGLSAPGSAVDRPDYGVPTVALLGNLPFDSQLEAAVGNPVALLESDFARSLQPIVDRILGNEAGRSPIA